VQTAAPTAPDPVASIEATLRTAKVVRTMPLSKRSWTLQVVFENGTKAVFKPFLKGNATAKYEVAYHRIARLLRLSNVPVAVLRDFPPGRLTASLSSRHPDVVAAYAEQVDAGPDGRVRGALIAWMDNLEPVFPAGAGTGVLADRFAGPPDREQLDLVRTVMADYLLGNWDRFSGGNLFRQKDGGGLVLLDHNGSFVTFSEKRQQKMDSYLGLLPCAPADLVARIRDLTEDDVRTASAADGTPILGQREIDALFTRRAELLRHCDVLPPCRVY